MDSVEQEGHRPLILARLEEIATELAASAVNTQPITPDTSIGRLSRLDSMQMQEMALASKRRLEDEREQLQQALRRIDHGTYGHCVLCGKVIDAERLHYQPAAETCMPCINGWK